MFRVPPPARLLTLALAVLAYVLQADAQSLSVSLTASDHNGYHVSCFGGRDGEIEVTANGGTPPYQYKWLHGDSTAHAVGLPAGYYKVKVTDADSVWVEADITLTDPPAIKIGGTIPEYPNGYNISCWECHNGSIQTAISGGVPPYTYLWQDSVTTPHRSNLGSKTGYEVLITDANGCEELSLRVTLTQPDRSDWTMGGNSNTDPDVHFLGTTDSADFVLKSNGQERLRLTGSGDVKLLGTTQDIGPVFRMEDGTLRGGLGEWPVAPECHDRLGYYPYWKTKGNAFAQLCPDVTPLLGTLGNRSLNIVTNNVQRMRILATGQVQIGGSLDEWPIGAAEGRLGIQQGANGNWLALHDRLSPPGTPSGFWGIRNHVDGDRLSFNFHPPAADVVWDVLTLHQNGKVSIGAVNTDTDLTYDYGLYLHKGLLTERVKVALKTSNEWSDHVFLPGYRLMPLKEVALFIAENGHLPGVPSASQMVEQGLDVVKTDAMLLEKIEELTLHTIALNERLGQAERIIAALMEQLKPTTE